MAAALPPQLDHAPPGRRDDLTFRANLKEARYGWLRLTPAYSVHLVARLLDEHAGPDSRVLDPFCGTGTTSLVCAERGVACDTTDINPFLVWLARAKTRRYASAEIASFVTSARKVERAIASARGASWTPEIHKIERWWSPPSLAALGRGRAAILRARETVEQPVANLLDVTFCRAMIESANVSFGHQSMSFRKGDHLPSNAADVAARFSRAASAIARAASSPVLRPPAAHLIDARDLSQLPRESFDCVITSPPYPNRMSYVRELRPYMYWLGYLEGSRDAGELDWRAIGGTWGCATSNVAKWEPPPRTSVPFRGFGAITSAIAERSDVLARYVAKYFHDATLHLASLFEVMRHGATAHYIVGNSKFYDVMLPVEAIYASIFEAAGFREARVTTIRKRTSKKELFEFVVSASKA
jgi:SAM-dependent methyltransferase